MLSNLLCIVLTSGHLIKHSIIMAMVNMNNLLNIKDSRWLQLEVCREFQRNKCTRPDTECKFAHPPANVEVQNGRVTACYDSIKVSTTKLFYFSFVFLLCSLFTVFSLLASYSHFVPSFISKCVGKQFRPLCGTYIYFIRLLQKVDRII